MDLKALGDALQLPHLPMVMECFDISNISTTHIVASMVSFKNGVPDKANYRRYRIKGVKGQNDFASMAEVVRRRYARVLLEAGEQNPDAAEFSQENPHDTLRRLASAPEAGDPAPTADADNANLQGDELIEGPGFEADETDAELDGEMERELEADALEEGVGDADIEPDGVDLPDLATADDEDDATTTPGPKRKLVRLPDLVIVDGGKGQLSSACAQLQKLGLHDLPIIGLPKEVEEIYRPGRPAPLRLPEDSGALRLLQRIRAEAHRFANGYHQLLMKRRIGESILDDCPGVSENRKGILLRAFGSVERLRAATVEQIADVEGIGQKLAEDVHRFLETH